MIYTACLEQAAAAYNVPPPAIEAIIASHHTNGIGLMGIPPEWTPILSHIGFLVQSLATSNCENIQAGAWIMAYEKYEHPGLVEDFREAQGVHTDSEPPPSPTGSTGVTPSCIQAAATDYALPVALLKGILLTEGGKSGEIHWNTNGSYDMGPAQINSTWLPKLSDQGITREMVINDGCLNVRIGAWILSQDMQGANPSEPAQFWKHVGDYNSTTPYWNQKYAKIVWSNIAK